VISDYSRKRVILDERTPAMKPAEYDMSGMFVLASGPALRTFVVRELVTGRPAEAAGIAVGDTIVSVNGQPAAALTLGGLRQLMKAGDRRTARIELERGGARRNVELRLRRLL
jgi:Periplasmic protease